MKTESSAPPEDPKKFVEQMESLEHISLDLEEVKAPENKGRRTVAKLCANTLCTE